MRLAPLFLAALVGLAPASPWAAEAGVEQLAWLAGCWQAESGEPGSVEHWLPPAGGTMLGVSRTVRQGRTVAFEFMQLRRQPDGVLALIPQPSGQPPTIFRLSSLGAAEVVFENPQHDFPQRIVYARPDDTRLLARIEGLRQGLARTIEFSFVRVACEPASGGPAR